MRSDAGNAARPVQQAQPQDGNGLLRRARGSWVAQIRIQRDGVNLDDGECSGTHTRRRRAQSPGGGGGPRPTPRLLLCIPDADYSIFAWRQQQQQPAHGPTDSGPVASSSRTPPPPPPPAPAMPITPTLHLHDPAAALPTPPAYRNPAYYTFQPARAAALTPPRRSPAPSRASTGGGSKKGRDGERSGAAAGPSVPKFKTQFDRFHSENGVRTVTGQIGPGEGW